MEIMSPRELPSPDERIARLRHARPDERERGIAELIDGVGRPLARQQLQRFQRAGNAVNREDVEDIVANVSLRLLTKLREAAESSADPIERFDEFVTTLTLNAVNDHFRRSFPQRARLKNRVRYTLTHDARLALWTAGNRLICGLAEWRGSDTTIEEVPPLNDVVTRRVRDHHRPANALAAFFEHCAKPVALELLVDTMAGLWHVVDVPAAAVAGGTEAISPQKAAEWRELLTELWRQILLLRPLQRRALLLNLRDAETSHALSLFVFTGIASFDDIADALGITPAALETIWNDLPFNDLRIAEMLQLTRQQVIDLRKSARERLTRRLRKSGS